MPFYCHQISFTNDAWARVMQNPNDRFEGVRGPIESLGGQIQATFFAVDSYDVLAITEFPDEIPLSAIAIAFSGGGEVAQIHTTRLLGASQALEAMRKAGVCTYRPLPHPRALAAAS